MKSPVDYNFKYGNLVQNSIFLVLTFSVLFANARHC